MRELASRFEPNPKYWLLASGSIRNVHEVMNRFGVLSVEGKRGLSRRAHDVRLYVMNGKGQLVQTMLASSALSDDIVDAVRDQRLVATR